MKRFLAALFVVFLHFSGQFASLGQIRNRYFQHWGFQDSATLFLDVLLLSLFAVGACWALDRLRFRAARSLYRFIFLLALVSGILANIKGIATNHHRLVYLLWVSTVSVAGFLLWRRATRPFTHALAFCLLFSPLVPIVFLETLTWASWSSSSKPLRALKTTIGKSHPVLFFVFDEWSYMRSTAGDELLPFFGHLRDLCHHSFVFRNARSPADTTYTSLPMLIYQTHDYQSLPAVFLPDSHRGGHVNSRPDELGPTCKNAPNLFSLASAHGYNTVLFGFYLPYGKMFGSELDCLRAYPHYPKGNGLFEKMFLGAIRNIRYWTDPFSTRLFRPLNATIFANHWLRINQCMRTDVIQSIHDFPGNTFCFIHYPLPHPPYIFNEDGSYRGVFPVDWNRAQDDDEDRMRGSLEDYQKHLMYLDFLLGEILDHLEAAGKLDDSLLVLTSDHSWREDPDPAYQGPARQHVPLVIKLPGQKSPHVVDEEFQTTRLKEIVEHALQGNFDEQHILNLVHALVAQSKRQDDQRR